MSYKYDVFISYSSVDKEWVLKLNDALVEADLKVWLDIERIDISVHSITAMEEGLKASKAIAIIVSPEAMKSGWVKEEYLNFLRISINEDQQRLIIPLILRDAELPGFLQNRQWVDFRDQNEFKISLQKLIWALKGKRLVETDPKPEGPIPLHEIMLKANHSLIISGHTLDKFIQDIKVTQTLLTLIERKTYIKIVLLNPYSSYAKAHEPFHVLESRTSSYEQITAAMETLRLIFEKYAKGPNSDNFEVLLSNYMPRFRTILIDDEVCYINLYMYGQDVGITPDFRLTKLDDGVNSSWFQTISESTHQLIKSNDVIPLIKNGYFNENWQSSEVLHFLNHCIETSCCRNCWSTVQYFILGYQHEELNRPAQLSICPRDYEPGTFTLNEITSGSGFVEPPMSYDDWITNVLDDELSLLEKKYPDTFLRNGSKEDVSRKVKTILELGPKDGLPLRNEIWYQEYPDVLRRLILTVLTGNPDFELDYYPDLAKIRKDFIFDVLDSLEAFKKPDNKKPDIKDWLHLSVAAGLLGVNEKSIHDATSILKGKSIILNTPDEDRHHAIERVSKELWEAAKSPCRIDASNFFFRMVETNSPQSPYNFKIASFPGDYLETIILLKFYEKLLQQYPKVVIDLVPKYSRCGNDATFENVIDLLRNKKFESLRSNGRFHVINSTLRL